MNRKLICTALALGICAISCHKAEKKKLLGTWLVTEFAGDDNGNKVMDVQEVRKAATGPMMSVTYTFKSGGDVEILNGDYIVRGDWKLKNGGDVITITQSGNSYDYKIISLDSKVLKTELEGTSGFLSWQTLEKQ